MTGTLHSSFPTPHHAEACHALHAQRDAVPFGSGALHSSPTNLLAPKLPAALDPEEIPPWLKSPWITPTTS